MPDQDLPRTKLLSLVADDPWRMACLAAVRDVMGVEGWIAAGFLRNLVWDRLHGHADAPLDDVDVVYFNPQDCRESTEKRWDAALAQALQGVPWSVKNQARMAARNGDAPYRDLEDALAHWLETATGIGVRLSDHGEIEVISAYGLDDLWDMVLRPTPAGLVRRGQLEARIVAKGWLARWPRLRLVWPDHAGAHPLSPR